MAKPRTSSQKAFLDAVAGHWPLAKGSLSRVRRPCVRPNCAACRRGERHAMWIFMVRRQGRSHCRYVPEALVEPLREAIANGRWLEQRLVEAGEAFLAQARRAGGARRRRQGPT